MKKFALKVIIVKWVEELEYGYGKAMRVIESDHKRFIKGSRFDYGFFNIATDEGYTIISLPMEKIKLKCDISKKNIEDVRKYYEQHPEATLTDELIGE